MSQNIQLPDLLLEFNEKVKTKTVGRPEDNSNEFWSSIDSTNTRLAKLAKEGVAEGCCVVAGQQTAGRGRLGRNWFSEKDSGLYFSTLLKPTKPLAELPVITLCLGVAAKRAVQAVSGVELGLKWVNDLIYQTKKCGGILAEIPMASEKNSGSNSLIIGIGINIKPPKIELPDEIKLKAIYLEEITSTAINTIDLATELCFQIEDIYNKMLKGDSKQVLDEWRASSVTLGKKVSTSDESVHGVAQDVDESGALIVKTETGIELVHAGEISIRSEDGSYSY